MNLEEVKNTITIAHDRLKRVLIENLDYKDLIRRYDRNYTLFYLDPPYRTVTSKQYHSYFKDEDFVELKNTLSGVDGKFILSLNSDDFIQDLFKDFRTEVVETTYSVMKNKSKKVKELLIFNY